MDPSSDRRLTTLQVGQRSPRLVLDAPPEQAGLLVALRAGVELDTTAAPGRRYPFVLAFASTLPAVGRIAALVGEALEDGDAVLWACYPKASSRRYRCEFNRDTGWQVLGDAGFEGVRQVAIDADWSALRFRRVEFIRSMTRDARRALTPEGRQRTAG